MQKFDFNNKSLINQYDNITYIEDSGVSFEEMTIFFSDLMQSDNGDNHDLIKANLFDYILTNGKIAIDKEDIFQEKVFDGDLIGLQRKKWLSDIKDGVLKSETLECLNAYNKYGSYRAEEDLGHTSPNTKILLKLGFNGLINRINNTIANKQLSIKQENFYNSCKIVLNACIKLANRLSDAILPFNKENAIALKNIANSAPNNIYEAMQLIVLYFFAHEYVYKTRVRTLGRLDVLLYPFYKNDIENGIYTKADVIEMLKYFFNKFSSAKVPFGLPFAIGGLDENKNEVTNEISYLIVDVYEQMNIYSPKIHIRVSPKTPVDFIKRVLCCIINGKSSFVFINDTVTVNALKKVGICEKDALDYTPIGCYEPAVWGKEIGCTGGAGVNLVKAVEYVLSGGYDVLTGDFCTFKPAVINTYEDFYNEVKKQIKFLTDKCIDYVNTIERYYSYLGPDSMLSAQYDDSVKNGIDVLEGGATYNNTSLNFYSLASLVDCLSVVKEFVFDKKIITLTDLFTILKNNWKKNLNLRSKILKYNAKYGNENAVADKITIDVTRYLASIVNNRKNSRGGVYKASLFTIDTCFYFGKRTFATPDGRLQGETLSKNLCASLTMDKNGILSLINSVTIFDHSDFPNGSVLDVVLHPSNVSGNDGLNAFYGIVKTYFDKGGFSIHGNVFNADELKKAQQNPEKYTNLQVRVCGWNAYFVNLTKQEQDAFITQATHVS